MDASYLDSRTTGNVVGNCNSLSILSAGGVFITMSGDIVGVHISCKRVFFFSFEKK